MRKIPGEGLTVSDPARKRVEFKKKIEGGSGSEWEGWEMGRVLI